MKGYYGKFWNELCNNGKEEIEKELRNEMPLKNIGYKGLAHSKNRKRTSLDTCKLKYLNLVETN
jgi:hypothetical protein